MKYSKIYWGRDVHEWYEEPFSCQWWSEKQFGQTPMSQASIVMMKITLVTIFWPNTNSTLQEVKVFELVSLLPVNK